MFILPRFALVVEIVLIVFCIQDTIEIKEYDTVTHVIYTIGSEQYSLRLQVLQ